MMLGEEGSPEWVYTRERETERESNQKCSCLNLLLDSARVRETEERMIQINSKARARGTTPRAGKSSGESRWSCSSAAAVPTICLWSRNSEVVSHAADAIQAESNNRALGGAEFNKSIFVIWA
jgi:hypothetical protein